MEQLFEAAEVCRAARIPAATLKSWLDRGSVKLSGRDESGGGRGRRRKFSLATITTIGIMGELCRRGLNAAQASKAAAVYAQAGKSGALGAQLLLVLTDRGARLVNAMATASLNEIAADQSIGFFPGSVLIVDLDRVTKKLFAGLRIPLAA